MSYHPSDFDTIGATPSNCSRTKNHTSGMHPIANAPNALVHDCPRRITRDSTAKNAVSTQKHTGVNTTAPASAAGQCSPISCLRTSIDLCRSATCDTNDLRHA